MQHSKIEWLRDSKGRPGYSANPIKGICQEGCDYCYAIRMYKRFKWDPETRFDYSELDKIDKIQIIKDGGYYYPKVFMCSTHDMFGDWIPDDWRRAIILKAVQNPKITFIYLTKNPQNAWQYTYPDNVWLGVSVESQEQAWRIKTLLQPEIEAKTKFVSFEPLQGNINFNPVGLSWIIVGAETGNRKEKIVPLQAWVTHVVEQCHSIPVFLKENLNYIGFDLHQQFPKV